MSAVPKFMPQPLHVAVYARDEQRRAALSRLMRDLGHVVVERVENAAIVLADGVAVATALPTVAIGLDDEEYEGRLPPRPSTEQIDAALRAVAAGLAVLPARESVRRFEALHEDDEHLLLTPRELEVIGAVSNGLTNKEIARDLGISRHTVKFHLESLMRKLNASCRAEAVSKSISLKLLEPYRA